MAAAAIVADLNLLADAWRRLEAAIPIRLIVGRRCAIFSSCCIGRAAALSALRCWQAVLGVLCCSPGGLRAAGWAFAIHGGHVLLAVLCSSSICPGFSLLPVRYLMRPSAGGCLRAE